MVAEAMADAGQHEQAASVAAQAETVARSITDPDHRAEALVAVAGALARAGQHEQALAAVAEAMAARGDYTQACLVASEACAVGRWTMVLGLVLSLEPLAINPH